MARDPVNEVFTEAEHHARAAVPRPEHHENTLMITRDNVETVLGQIRPFLQADGGDIELVGVEGNSADVRLTGMCAVCPSAQMTLHLGVEAALRKSLPGFETLRVVYLAESAAFARARRKSTC